MNFRMVKRVKSNICNNKLESFHFEESSKFSFKYFKLSESFANIVEFSAYK